MDKQENKDPLHLLRRIAEVEAPPFLLTRIQQKITDAGRSQFSRAFIISLGSSFILLAFLNLAIIVRNYTPDGAELTESMGLLPDNALYHE
jgi:hypothetical protein